MKTISILEHLLICVCFSSTVAKTLCPAQSPCLLLSTDKLCGNTYLPAHRLMLALVHWSTGIIWKGQVLDERVGAEGHIRTEGLFRSQNSWFFIKITVHVPQKSALNCFMIRKLLICLFTVILWCVFATPVRDLLDYDQ